MKTLYWKIPNRWKGSKGTMWFS